VHDFQRGDTPASLTDRQRAALDTALDLGYYDVPRAASVADVAVELDCATSTAGELLRKAGRASSGTPSAARSPANAAGGGRECG